MEFNRIFLTILLFITTGAVLFFFVLPKYREVAVLADTVVQKQAEYEGKFIYYTRAQELLATIEKEGESLDKIASAIPPEFSYAELIYFLHKNASDSGLQIESITFATPSANNPAAFRPTAIKEANFSLKVSGSYDSIKTFMGALETSARLFRVDSLSFAAAVDPITSTPAKAGPGQEKKYDFQMVVKTNSY